MFSIFYKKNKKKIIFITCYNVRIVKYKCLKFFYSTVNEDLTL